MTKTWIIIAIVLIIAVVIVVIAIPIAYYASVNSGSDQKTKNDNSPDLRSLSSFENDMLKAHNRYRRKHGVPDLVLSHLVTKYAQKWADYLIETNSFEHRYKGDYGENLYATYDSGKIKAINARAAVDAWYNEIKLYNYNMPKFEIETGHFTQLIWKSSIRLGCAYSQTKDKKRTVYVCNYDPPGNVKNQFAINVPPPLKKFGK